MVNFGPRDTVPEKFASRHFVIHNPNVTLMRTTPRREPRRSANGSAQRLNLMEGPVRFLLPEGGVSMLDRPGAPFHDPEADEALFEAIEKTVRRPAAPVERVQGKHQRSVVFRRGGRGFPFDFTATAKHGLSMIAKSGSRFSEVCSSALKTLRLK